MYRYTYKLLALVDLFYRLVHSRPSLSLYQQDSSQRMFEKINELLSCELVVLAS